MDILDGAGLKAVYFGEREIVGADQADRAFVYQCADEALRSDAPVRRIRALKQFVQQEQQRQPARLEQPAQARDLRVEARAAFMQRIIDANTRADLQRSQLQ